jgi:hypothetical protein
MSELRRRTVRRETGQAAGAGVAGLDLCGMVLMAAPAAVQAVQTSAGYGILAAGIASPT